MPTGVITISQYTYNPPQQVDSNSLLEVRGWYSGDYISVDLVTPIFGNSTNGEQGPYYSTTPTLNGSGEIVVPAHDVQITVGANPTANYFEGLWIDGAFVMLLMPNTQGATGWQIPSVYGDPIAYDEIATYNRARRLVYAPDTFFTADQTIQEIERLAGNFDYAAVGVNGITSMSVPPALASLPIAVGKNDHAAISNEGVTRLSAAPAVASVPIAVADTDVRVNSNYPLRLTLPYSGSSIGAQLRALKMSGGVATLTIAGDTSGCIALGFSASTNEVVAVGQGYGVCAVDNAVAIGDYLQISSSANGTLHSTGSTYPSSGQIVGRALSIDVDGVCALDFFGSEVRALPAATSTATANTLVQRNSNAAATVYDLGGQVFNPRAYGATGDGSTDDIAAFRSAVTAIETGSGGGVLEVSPGNYRWASALGGALLTVAKNLKLRVSEGAKIIIDSSIAGTTDWILVKPAANYVMNAFSIEGGTFEPSNWNQVVGYVSPGRDGVRFDLTNSGSQIRNMRIVGNTWRNTNRPWNTNITHADAFFTNYFEDNYLLGAPNFGAGTGDTIILQNNSITSLQADQAMEFTQAATGATSCVLLNNNITCGGGVIFHSGVNPIIIGGIIECANASLTTGATTALVYFRGDVQTIENPVIQCVSLVSVGTALNGIKLGATNKAIIGDGIAYNLPVANVLLDAGASSFATLLGQNWPITGGGGGDGVTGAGYASVDTQFSQRLKSYKQPGTVLLQQGSLYLTGQMMAGSGATGGGFGFGSGKPQILSGTGDPSGVVSAPRNSIWIRDDAAGIWINTTVGTGITWAQLTIP